MPEASKSNSAARVSELERNRAVLAARNDSQGDVIAGGLLRVLKLARVAAAKC